MASSLPSILMNSANGLALRAMQRAAAAASSLTPGRRLAESFPGDLVNDIFSHALKKQTGVSLKYMLDFGSNPIERQLVLSAQFLHKELPVRLAHRVAELENLPYGLSSKSNIIRVGGRERAGRRGAGRAIRVWGEERAGAGRWGGHVGGDALRVACVRAGGGRGGRGRSKGLTQG